MSVSDTTPTPTSPLLSEREALLEIQRILLNVDRDNPAFQSVPVISLRVKLRVLCAVGLGDSEEGEHQP